MVPAPHFLEQALHAPNGPYAPSTIALPQALVCIAPPEHGAPHALPAIQGRDLVCVPIPHLVEQALHAPYPPHLESTIAVPQGLVSVLAPEHAAPHALPAIHGRVLVWLPIPHFTEQAPHAPNDPHLELTIAVPHGLVSVLAPEHAAPHALPAIHGRVLVWLPIPHFVEQAPHAPNDPHLELTIGEPQALVSVLAPTHAAPHALPATQPRDLV